MGNKEVVISFIIMYSGQQSALIAIPGYSNLSWDLFMIKYNSLKEDGEKYF